MPTRDFDGTVLRLLLAIHKRGNTVTKDAKTLWPLVRGISMRGGGDALRAFLEHIEGDTETPAEKRLVSVDWQGDHRSGVNGITLTQAGLRHIQQRGHDCTRECTQIGSAQ